MNHAESKNPILEGSDILFECGQCGKSLAIDCRGAGLNIRCPQCDSELEVPIPEGFDIAELDKEISESVASAKEIKVPMPGFNAAATDVIEKVAPLGMEREAIPVQRQDTTQQNAELRRAIKVVNKQVDELRKALGELAAALARAEQEAGATQAD